jgi:hypothetical protein
VKTYQEGRESVEARLCLYEGQINDRMEWVFNGWVRYEQIAQEIEFFKGRALNCRYLLIVSQATSRSRLLNKAGEMLKLRATARIDSPATILSRTAARSIVIPDPFGRPQ